MLRDAACAHTETCLPRTRGGHTALAYTQARIDKCAALPGLLVELLEDPHQYADAHHEGCDFHGSPPQVGAWLALCES